MLGEGVKFSRSLISLVWKTNRYYKKTNFLKPLHFKGVNFDMVLPDSYDKKGSKNLYNSFLIDFNNKTSWSNKESHLIIPYYVNVIVKSNKYQLTSGWSCYLKKLWIPRLCSNRFCFNNLTIWSFLWTRKAFD